MKINLSKKELEKTYQLLDTKEINMSIAELLFSIFEEKEAFKGSTNCDIFYEKLLSYWGIPSDDYEERKILEKWVKPVISPLKVDFFSEHSYFKAVQPKPFKEGSYSLSYIIFKAYQPFSLNDIEVDEKDNFLERSPISYCLKDE